LFYAAEIYVIFQTKLVDECSSLQTTVNILKCKLESCQKKVEAGERKVEELQCQNLEQCNMIEVIVCDICDYAVVM